VPLANARQFADLLHLRWSVREHRPDAQHAAEVVIGQVPAAGAPVHAGDRVELVVSSGPATPPAASAPGIDGDAGPAAADAATPGATVEVPRLLGLRVARARALLEGAGLRVGSQRRIWNENRESRVVLRQSAAPGTQVAAGTAVDLVVNADAPPEGEEH
jgi:beta-lactam-binding protein with PASTA domain